MEIGVQPKLQFFGVDIPTIHLTSSTAITQKDSSDDMKIDIRPKVFYPKDQPRYFKIIMDVRVSSENHFDLSILSIGAFAVNTDITDDIKKQLINVNAPAIMFPYIRSFINTLTANLGSVTGAITLPPRFFRGMLEELTEKELTDTHENTSSEE